MLHDAHHSALVWRLVANSLHPRWGIAAPDLFDAESLDAMVERIKRDAHNTGISDDGFIIVAPNEAAMPAIWACADSDVPVQGVILSRPVLKVSRSAVRAAKVKASLAGRYAQREELATRPQTAHYLGVLAAAASGDREVEGKLRAVKERFGATPIPVRVLNVEKAKPDAFARKLLGATFADLTGVDIAGAEADWFDYAAHLFAKNIEEFVSNVNEHKGQKDK